MILLERSSQALEMLIQFALIGVRISVGEVELGHRVHRYDVNVRMRDLSLIHI